jgi:hypothetical protein
MAHGTKTGGRQKGTPNKVTQDVRKAVAGFVEGNVGKLQSWLNRVAKDDPAKAADLFVRVLEFHLPKLARTEIEGEIGINHDVTDKPMTPDEWEKQYADSLGAPSWSAESLN